MLRIFLLGPVEARVEDRLLRVTSRSQLMLVTRLALAAGRPVHVDQLVQDLWEGEPPGDAAHALQAHVSRLRAVLPAVVEHVHGGYRFVREGVELDTDRFHALTESGRAHLAAGRPEDAAADLRQALGLWRGPALAGLAESPALRPAAVRLEELRGSVLSDRIDADLASGGHQAVVGELEELIANDSVNERTWHQLITALARSGRKGDALAAYRRARTSFVDELGVEPGEDLHTLHQDVLEERITTVQPPDQLARPAVVPTPSAPPAAVTRRMTTEFSGRDDELAMLDRAWLDRHPGPRFVALTGEPGIGKTRLAAEFAVQRSAEGARVLFGRCDQFLSVPYQPFTEILRGDVAALRTEHPESWRDVMGARLGPFASHLAQILPELSTVLPDSQTPRQSPDPDTERYRLFEAVAGWLAAASSRQPLVLLLDDLQWADQPSLLLLQHLLRSSDPIRGLVLATYRDRELADTDPGRQMLDEVLRTSETVSPLPLSGLAPDAVQDLLRAELRSGGAETTPSDAFSRWVETTAGGNPLFVLELARQATDPDHEAAAHPRLPQGVRHVIDLRLRRLPKGMRDVLACAAVVGREFDTRVVQVATGMDDATMDDLLRTADDSRLIESRPDAGLRYLFSHDVVRTVLYDALGPLRRAGLHRRVAEAIEQLHVSDLDEHYNELAHHYAEAAVLGPTDEAVQYLLLAGRAAADQRAPSVSVRHYRAALDLAGGQLEPEQRCDLLIALGIAERDAGQACYRETLLAAATQAHSLKDGGRRLAAAAVENTRGWYSSAVEPDVERLTVLEAALGSRDATDPATLSSLLSNWAIEAVRDPSLRLESVRRSTEALRLARSLADPHLLASTLADHYSVTYASFVDPHGCRAISEELVELADRQADPWLQLLAEVGHAQSTVLVGDLEAADHFLMRAEDSAQELNHHARLWLVRSWRAMRLALRGHLEEAEAGVIATFELGEASQQPDAFTWLAGQLFTLRWQQGRLAELMDEIESQVTSHAHGIPAWRGAYALALAEVGRDAEASAILDDFVALDLEQLPLDMLWLQGMAYLCSTCALLQRSDAASVLYEALLPYEGLLADNGTLSAGPVDFHLGRMAALADRPREAIRHLTAADAMCQRIDAPLWSGWTRQALAELDESRPPSTNVTPDPSSASWQEASHRTP
ncbi:MAG: AAA family ATPase [Nocardioides sp.]|nr:AAA family ATPase [Nocardioides sp.]